MASRIDIDRKKTFLSKKWILTSKIIFDLKCKFCPQEQILTLRINFDFETNSDLKDRPWT